MINITGKVLVFSDIHFGRFDSSTKKKEICSRVVDRIVELADSDGIENILFCGDLHHDRHRIDVQVINESYSAVERLAKNHKVFLIVGNHDAYETASTKINSLNIFRSIENVEVISDPTEAVINGHACLLAPWGTVSGNYESRKFKAVFGHLDISVSFLKDSYIQNNIINPGASKAVMETLMKDEIFDTVQIETKEETEGNVNYLNSFLGIIEDNGLIVTGHIHNRDEKSIFGSRIIFAGSPWQQTYGESSSDDGLYVFDRDFSYTFHPLRDIPHMVQIYVSDIMRSGIEKFDTSVITGNTIRLVYDMLIDDEEDARIVDMVKSANPFFIDQSDFRAKTKPELSTSVDFMENLRMGKWDQIHKYLREELPDSELSSKGIDRDFLENNVIKRAFNEIKSEE